jgi:hypothetical protein
VVCSGTIEGSEKISSSQSQLPRSVFWLLNTFLSFNWQMGL